MVFQITGGMRALRAVSPAFHRKSSPSVAGCPGTQFGSAQATPSRAATYFTLVPCRVTCLSASAKRFSAMGSPHYATSTITKISKWYSPSSNPSRYGPGCSGPSLRRLPRKHEQEPRSAKRLRNGAPPGCQLTTWGASTASQDADR